MARMYAKVVGVVFLIWGLIGLFSDSFLGISTTGLQVWLFIVAGVLGVWFGFSGKGLAAYAKTFGIVFTLGGLLGFILPSINSALTIDSGAFANIIHLIAGLWGLWVGFGGRKGNVPAAPASPAAPSEPSGSDSV